MQEKTRMSEKEAGREDVKSKCTCPGSWGGREVERTGRDWRRNGERGEWRYNNLGSSLSRQGIFKSRATLGHNLPRNNPHYS